MNDQEILAQLDRTADGVPITPKTPLWQVDPQGFVNDGWPWQAGPGWTFQRSADRPVYSSCDAALSSLTVAQLVKLILCPWQVKPLTDRDRLDRLTAALFPMMYGIELPAQNSDPDRALVAAIRPTVVLARQLADAVDSSLTEKPV